MENENREIIKYAFESFGFLLTKKRKITLSEFASIISKNYDSQNLRVKEVIETLLLFEADLLEAQNES